MLKTCERCGWSYDSDDKKNLIMVYSNDTFKCYDLCPKCMEKTKSWLNNERKNCDISNKKDRNGQKN